MALPFNADTFTLPERWLGKYDLPHNWTDCGTHCPRSSRWVVSAVPDWRKNSSICQWRKAGSSARRGFCFLPPLIDTGTIGRTGLVGEPGIIERQVSSVSDTDNWLKSLSVWPVKPAILGLRYLSSLV